MKYLLTILTVVTLFFAAATPVSAQNKDSVQGDFEALQALYNSTQGEGIEVLSSEGELPPPSMAQYPYMYIINDEIYALSKERTRRTGEWVNHGAIWKDKTGWDNMTPETMGDAVGVTTDSNGRVTILNLQSVVTEPVGDGGLFTIGNGVIGTLPPEIGNLKKMQWFNIKQNFFHGEIPDVFGGWNDLERWSVGGQHWEIDLDRRRQWHESDHGKANYDDNPFTTSSPNIGKKIVSTNNFRTQLPASLGGLPKLDLIEVAHQYLIGSLPSEWGELPSIRGIYMPDPRGPESVQLGEIPDSWGNLTTIELFNLSVYHTYPRYTGQMPGGMKNWSNLANFIVPNMSGPIPVFEGLTDLIYFAIGGNFSSEFPWESIFNGNNSRLSSFSISNGNLTGSLPSTIPEATFPNNDFPNYRLSRINFSGNSFEGPLPDWITKISGIQLVNISDNNFSGDLPAGFHDSESPLYHNLRYLNFSGNNFSGSLPRTNFKNSVHKGHVVSSSGRSVDLNMELGVIESGVIGNSSSDWIRDDRGSSVPWGSSWENHEVTIIVPGGANITFEVVRDTNFEHGYLYARSQADVSGTEGYKYEIRPLLTGKSILFKGDDGAIAREIKEVSGSKITLDQPIENDISSYTFTVHDESTNLLYIRFDNNSFSGGIPEEWAGIRTIRDFRIRVQGNHLSGVIDEDIAKIANLDELNISNNRFSESDIQPILNVMPSSVDFRYSGQQPLQDGDGEKGAGDSPPDSPQLKYPENSATGLPYESSLQWESSGADQYRVQVRSGDSTETVLDIKTKGNPVSISDWADYGQTYRWRVQAIKNDLESEWSPEWSFTTEDDPGKFPSAPVQLGPDHFGSNVSLTPEFSWSDIGADYYILHSDRSTPSGLILDVVVSDTTFTPSEIFGADAMHYWRVRGVKDGVAGEWSPVHRFRTREANIPEMPDIVSPEYRKENADVTSYFEWRPVEADHYQFRLRERNGSQWLLMKSLSENKFYPEQNLDPETEYIWQVKSVRDGIEGAWTPMWEFSTGEFEYVVEAPELIAPGQGAEYGSLSPTFEWNTVKADQYVITVSKEQPSRGKMLSSIGTEEYVIHEYTDLNQFTPGVPLEPETVYYWRVQAIKDDKESEWSELWEFKTPREQIRVSNEPDERAAVTDLYQNYPNPFNPTTQIEFTLSNVEKVSLRVYDLAGREVAKLADGVLQAGRHAVTFDASNLASGVYFYRFITDTKQFTRKMTLVK